MKNILFLSLLLLPLILPARSLTPAEMQHDLKILHASWISMHPGIYRYNTAEEVESYFNDLHKACAAGMSDTLFFIRLSQLCEKIKCGHTFLNPLNLDSVTARVVVPQKVIPFFFRIVDEKIIVTHSFSAGNNFRNGDEVISINGVSTKAIIDSLLTVSRSDGRNGMGKRLDNINETPGEMMRPSLFDVYAPMFFKWKGDECNLGIRHYPSGQTSLHRDNLISYQERSALYKTKYGVVPSDEASWEYKILNQSVAYMKFGTFAFWNSKFNAHAYIDSVFNDLCSQKAISKLIIDIRENEGGDSELARYILSHLTEKKISLTEETVRAYRYLEVPDTLLPYLSTWDRSFKQPKDSSLYKKNEMGLWEIKRKNTNTEEIIPAAVVFSGKVTLLTGPKNSSAGFKMAYYFRQGNFGTIAGETTGGTLQGINGGEFFFLTLPHSHFEIDLPLIYQGLKNQPDSGIVPDRVITLTQLDIYEELQLEMLINLD